jgi:uncharacterized protein (DUF111 family)
VKRDIGGTKAIVDIDQDHHKYHHRNLSDILEILQHSNLEQDIRDRSAQVFRRIAEAEARVHRKPRKWLPSHIDY